MECPRPGNLARLQVITIGFSVIASITIFACASRADDIAYEVASSRDFGTVDLNTGVYTEIGKTQNLPVIGLGESGGTLYTVSDSGPNGATLYSINTATGNFTAIGNGLGSSGSGAGSTIHYALLGSTTSGLFVIGATEATGVLEDNLYSINPTTGVATFVAQTLFGSAQAGTASLSNSAAGLYLYDGFNLYTVNPTSGVASLVGSSLPFASDATTFVNGTLYGTLESTSSFYSLNATTAQATFVSTQSNGPSGGLVSALAPVPVAGPTVPEPGSMGLFGLGVLCLGSLFSCQLMRRSRVVLIKTGSVRTN